MKRNNIRLLTDKELNILNYKYTFEIEDDNILVKLNHIDRITYHDINKPFSINVKNLRKITFNLEAIEIWKNLYNDKLRPNLIEIQQAVNKLIITYQQVNIENVKGLLNGQTIKIKKI